MQSNHHSGHRIIVLETSEPPDKVIGSIRKSGQFEPLVCWEDTRGFHSEPTDALDSAVPSSHRQTREFYNALSAVQESRADATFLLFVPEQAAKHAPRREWKKLKQTALSLHQQENARLILTFCHQKSEKLMKDVRHDHTEIASGNDGSPRPQEPSEYAQILGQAPSDGYWAFADDPKWKDWVDDLTPGVIEAIVKQGLHKVAAKRIRAAITHVGGLLLDRDKQLEIMAACAIARTNVVFLGPPGTAKSLLVREFSKALGIQNVKRHISEEGDAIEEAKIAGKPHADGEPNDGTAAGEASDPQDRPRRRMFEYLLSRYTTPEEIFGATDIDVLIHGGVHARRTTGMLPQAEMAFLDEIFKANSAILNTLLSLTNERIFYNMGQAFRVDLAFVVGASNESPDQSELGALFDRFPIRVPCPAVPERDVRELVQRSHKITHLEHFGDRRVERKACLNDLRLLHKVIIGGVCGGMEALGQGDIPDLFFDLFLGLRRDYGVSDRTPEQILRVCRALAVLDGRDELSASHLRAWGYIAPQYKERIPVQRFVLDEIKKVDNSAIDLF